MKIKIKSIDYQRNGVTGAGFHVVHFTDGQEPWDEMIGIVFEEPKYIAVISPWAGTEWIKYHWRGDYYEDALREVVGSWERPADYDPIPRA